MNRVIFVVGPTATGKSALALALAEEFGGVILNCDSLQACRRLDVGTAKPDLVERGRLPHYLFDVVEPGQRFTAGDFRRLALAQLARIPGPTFAVGGSGFYIRALERGMFDAPAPSAAVEREVRERLARDGGEVLFAELRARDADYAATISANDTYRVSRALMMMNETGRTVTALRAGFRPVPLPYPTLKLGLDLESQTLLARVNARTERMLASGLLDETRALVDEGFGAWPALASVGYKECRAVLDGELDQSVLSRQITQKTMALVKKQRTWFKRDRDVRWLDANAALGEARDLVRRFIDRNEGAS